MAELKVYVRDQNTNPLESVLVRLVDSTNTTTLSQTSTDAQGVAAFDPAAGDYVIRLYKEGVYFDGLLGDSNRAIQAVSVAPAGSAYDVVGRIPDAPESSDSRLCLVSGTLVDLRLSGDFPAVPVVTFSPSDTWQHRVFGESLVLGEEVVARPDDDGNLSVPLVRGGAYVVSVGDWRTRDFDIQVPHAPSARLEDLVFPYPTALSLTPDTLSLSVGDVVTVAAQVTMSDGTTANPLTVLSLVYSTPGVVSVSQDSGGLVVTAEAAGSTVVGWSLRDNVRDPEPSTSGFPQLTVTVV